MPRPPNYNQARRDRDRLKAEKKADKIAVKAVKKHSEDEPDTPLEDSKQE